MRNQKYTLERLEVCHAKGMKCIITVGHFWKDLPEDIKTTEFKETSAAADQLRQSRSRQEKEEKQEEEEEQNVFGNDGVIMMKGKINWRKCCLMIDSESPVIIISHDELQKILQYDVLLSQQLPKDEKYVDFNKIQVNLLEYILCELEGGGKYIRNARKMVARRGAQSAIRTDRLKNLQTFH